MLQCINASNQHVICLKLTQYYMSLCVNKIRIHISLDCYTKTIKATLECSIQDTQLQVINFIRYLNILLFVDVDIVIIYLYVRTIGLWNGTVGMNLRNNYSKIIILFQKTKIWKQYVICTSHGNSPRIISVASISSRDQVLIVSQMTVTRKP